MSIYEVGIEQAIRNVFYIHNDYKESLNNQGLMEKGNILDIELWLFLTEKDANQMISNIKRGIQCHPKIGERLHLEILYGVLSTSKITMSYNEFKNIMSEVDMDRTIVDDRPMIFETQ